MNSTSSSLRLEHFGIHVSELAFPKLCALLFAGSFLVHVIVVAIFIHQPIALDDMFQYDMLGRSLAAGNGYRWYAQADVEILRPYYAQFLDLDHLAFPVNGLETTFRAPGYPFFLALIYLFVPAASRFILARLAQAALAAALAPLAAALARQAGFSRQVSLLAALGISLYPILLFYPIGLASENLYVPLGLAAILAILRAAKKKSWRWIVLAGLACGLAMLARSIFAGFTLLAAAWLWRFCPYHWKAGLVFLFTAFGLCLPWAIRNSILMGRPAFVENSGGYNLFIGYHPQGDGGFVSRIAILPMNILDDGARESDCARQALEFIRQDPLEAARRVLVRLVKFIGPEDREFYFFYSNNAVGAVSQPWLGLVYGLLVIPWASTLLLGSLGLWLTGERKVAWLALLFLAGYGLPHLLIIAEPRFHLAWAPVLLPFAAQGWVSLRKIQWRQFLRGKNWLLAGILLGIVVLFVVGFALNFSRLIAVMSPGGNELYYSY